MTEETPIVGVLAASPTELPIMRQAGLILEKFGIPHEVQIMSSSRTPDLVDEYARTAAARGLRVVVCSTGMSGHLAAAVAARTVIPVIGVPIATPPQMVGNEALAITAQMPTGVPIATVGVDAAVNAAVLAAQMGLGDEAIQAMLWKFKDDLAEGLKLRSRATGSPRWRPWSDEARLSNWLEIELLAVEALAELGTVRPTMRRPVARAPRSPWRPSPSGRRSRATTSLPSTSWRSDRPRGSLAPLRPHVLRRARHRVRAPAPGGRGRVARRARTSPCRDRTARDATSRHRDGRPLPRGDRRADQLRAQARGLGVRAGS